MSKVEQILDIVKSLSEAKENNGLKPTAKLKPEDQDLAQIIRILVSLTPEEFEDFEAGLLEFVIVDWEESTNSCIVTLELIADIFVYICTISAPEVAERYAFYFTQPSTPPQVSLIFGPLISRCISSRSAQDQLRRFIGKLELFKRNRELALNLSLISEFLSCHHVIQKLSDARQIFQLIKCISSSLKSNPSETSIIISSLLLSFLPNGPCDQTAWTEMSSLIAQLYLELPHFPILRSLASLCISKFLSSVILQNESWLENVQCLKSSALHSNPHLNATPEKASTSQTFQASPATSSRQVSSTPEVSSQEKIDPFLKPSQRPVSAPVGKQKGNEHTSGSPKRPQGQPGQNPAKFLELLEKLVTKMMQANVEFESESEKFRLRELVGNLNDFL